jgi:hypothetical protein
MKKWVLIFVVKAIGLLGFSDPSGFHTSLLNSFKEACHHVPIATYTYCSEDVNI